MQTIQLDSNKNTKHRVLPEDMVIERGETQKDVNITLLNGLIRKIEPNKKFKAIDLPCGDGKLIEYIGRIFPDAELHGADIIKKEGCKDVKYYQVDLSKDFSDTIQEKFDLITSVSGVMMFGNTLNFIENCSSRINKGGLFVITNDNSSTIIDRLAFLGLGRHRQFPLVYEDHLEMTQNIPLQELVRLIRKNEMEIEKVEYTSFYYKDLIFIPFALLIAPFHYLHIRSLKTDIPRKTLKQMFGIKQFFYKHYIIYSRKK